MRRMPQMLPRQALLTSRTCRPSQTILRRRRQRAQLTANRSRSQPHLQLRRREGKGQTPFSEVIAEQRIGMLVDKAEKKTYA
mmetsp:Transcript_7998/g.12055  ORF Transcript_7998/g.12055 Transcript_7998/m.12055 type:complete len:82 (-) Transcript_7998:240-485(-)